MHLRAIAVAGCLAFASVAFAAALTYAEAAALSDRDEEALPAADYQALLAAHGKLVGAAASACIDRANPPAKIRAGVIMELDAQGRVVRTWRRDNDALSACIERQSAGVLLFVPPRAPFYTGFSLDLDVNIEG